jgi:hypothetical protein
LAAGRLREAGIVLAPLLRSAGLSVSQINKKDMRLGIASQIMFLELTAKALKDPLLGFSLARDGDLRQIGLLYYTAASSETLGEALARAERYSSIVNAGLVWKCFVFGKPARDVEPGVYEDNGTFSASRLASFIIAKGARPPMDVGDAAGGVARRHARYRTQVRVVINAEGYNADGSRRYLPSDHLFGKPASA